MLSFKKIQNGEKKLTGSELNKIKYHIKWPKNFQKNYLFVILCKTETSKVSKFLLLSNLDYKSYIYAIKIPFNLSRSSFKDNLLKFHLCFYSAFISNDFFLMFFCFLFCLLIYISRGFKKV